MKPSKALVAEVLTQVVAIATLLVQQYVAPDALEIALAIIAAVEGIGQAVVVYLVQQGRIEELSARIETVAKMRR